MTDMVLAMVARFSLTRACGFGSGLRIRTFDGAATLYGKVRSHVVRERAEAALRGVSGVRELWSLVRVVEDTRRGSVEQSDSILMGAVRKAMRSDTRLRGMHVLSVDDGVVLLAGQARDEKARTQAAAAIREQGKVRDVVTLAR